MNTNRSGMKRLAGGALALIAMVGTAAAFAAPQMIPVTTPKKAAELTAAAKNWLNTGGTTVHLYGKDGLLAKSDVVVLTFWTHQCINCKRTIPYWSDWAKQYKGTDVSVVSVHTPETAEERVPANVRRFVTRKNVSFPVAIDNDAALWNAYDVQAWPTTILIDKKGQIRARWEGELNWENSGEYKKVEQTIEQLRKEGK